MTAQVIDFATAASQRAKLASRVAAPRSSFGPSPTFKSPGFDLAHQHAYWNGASGIRYVHTVFGLLDCPEIPNANIVLARRAANGRAQALYIGRVERDTQSLNLAEIRRTAALLGATEVHVHFLATSAEQRERIETDINSADVQGSFGVAAG